MAEKERCLGRQEEAIGQHKISLNVATQNGDKVEEARANGNLGICYKNLGQYDKAIHYHQTHLDIATQIGDKAGKGRANANLGVCYQKMGQYDKAIHHYQIHLNIVTEIGDQAGKGRANSNLGICYQNVGQYDKAIHHHQTDLDIATQIGDKAGKGRANCNLGICYQNMGQYDKAIYHHQIDLDIATQVGDTASKGYANGNLGVCFMKMGQYDKAIHHQQIVLNIATEIGDKAGKGYANGNLGVCYMKIGQYDKAVYHQQIVLNIATEIGDKAGRGRANGNLGNCYCNMGLNIATDIGDKEGEGRANGHLGICYQSMGQYDKAEAMLNKSVALQDELFHNTPKLDDSKISIVDTFIYFLSALIVVLISRGKTNEALLTAENRRSRALTDRVSSGHHARFTEAPSTADVLDFSALLKIVKALGTTVLYYALLGSHLCFWVIKPNGDVAFRHHSVKGKDFLMCKSGSNLMNFYKLIKNTRDLIKSGCSFDCEDRSLSFMYPEGTSHQRASQINPVVGLAKMLNDLPISLQGLPQDCASNPNGQSVETVVTRQSLGENKAANVQDDPTKVRNNLPETQDEPAKIQDNFAEIQDEPAKIHENLSETQNEPAKIEENLSETQDEPAKIHENPSETQDEPAKIHENLSETQDEPAKIHENLSETQDEPAKVQDNLTETQHEPAKIQGKHREPNLFTRLQQMYDNILRPVREFLEGSQVVVVPDGSIPLLPFACLIDEDECFVASDLQFRLVPSLTIAKMISEHRQEPQGQASPLIVGDPEVCKFQDGGWVYDEPRRLPHANKEAHMIAQMLNVQPLTDGKATKEGVLQRIESANLIHVAAHGDSDRGEILLAPSPDIKKETILKEDIMLTVQDLEQKRLRAQLVVLSCCHSGHGDVRAEGVVGIARAFLGAGARAVLVTLWAISDKATFFFMEKFYGQLVQGKSASKALDEAMYVMRESEEFKFPYHWAPFVLIGDDVTPFSVQ